jgi:hypothetical protein
MILGLLRLGLVLGVGLTAVYFLLAIYSRSVRREALEKEYDEGGIDAEREAFIAEGMQRYEHSLRRKLIWLVYIIPTVVIMGLVYILNFQ